MSVIFFLVSIGILVAGGFLAAFIWSVKSGQYDDDYTPSVRMLFDNYNPDDQSEEAPDNSKEDSNNSDKKSNSDKSNHNKS
jgi:cbb3-type cytochrome oxidase maturation protein